MFDLRARQFLIALGLSGVLAGCAEKSPGPAKFPAARMAGMVTLDGEPLENGSVMFSPLGGTGAPVSLPIVQGKFSGEAVPKGKLKIVISAMVATGKMNTEYSQPFPERVNLVPAKYRDGIDFELSEDQPDIKFELTSE